MAKVDVFISYTGDDRAWAEWIAWQLEAAGSTTVLQAWDFQPGGDFVERMHQAVDEAERTIAVLSPAYLESAFGGLEWRSVLAKDPSGEKGLLVPVRVEECEPSGLLTGRIYLDLVGLPEAEAADRLVAALRQGERMGRPQHAPAFPGVGSAGAGGPAGVAVAPPFPGRGPSVSNLAPRNPHFTGRVELLDRLEEQLAGGVAAVVAAHGLGGVGKSQLVLEYAHRHAAEYDLVWWVPAETRLLATGSLAELALRLGLPAQAEQAEQAAGALAELSRRERWLVVFDNAEDPSELEGLWPVRAGQVLVTSRNPAWGGHGARLAVNVLANEEAVALLLARTASRDQQAAWALAGELGGLPLALEQAAAYLEETGITLAVYLARYRRYQAQLLARGQPTRYPATVATTWQLNLDQLADSPAAVGLLGLCAFLGPEVIPPGLLAADPTVLPGELAAASTDELALDDTIAALYRYSLVDRDHDGLRLHRLVGEVVRATLEADQAQRWAGAAVALVAAAFPTDVDEPASWPECARLVPHALAATAYSERLAVAAEPTAALLNQVGRYLRRRAVFGAARAAHQRALTIAEAALGPDHPTVAVYVNNLGLVLRDLGDLDGAKTHLERALAIDEATSGPNHPAVARDVNNLGEVLRDLGDLDGAKAHLERALGIFEVAYGPEHPQTQAVAGNLARLLDHR